MLKIVTTSKIAASEKLLALLENFTLDKAEDVLRFHVTLPGYAATPLIALPHLAKHLGVQELYVKDESQRFGLNAFKALGASFAVGVYLADLLAVDLSYAALRSERTQEQLRARGGVTLVTATDGNHGRGLAWSAALFGLGCEVFLPQGSASERVENIRKLGAKAAVTELNYDDAVRKAAACAQKYAWVLMQDTAWPGYEEIPLAIMRGYATLALEAAQQLAKVEAVPTHIFLQAGVGSLAAALTAFFVNYYQARHWPLPIITIVEPENANCLYLTAQADDGDCHAVTGTMSSMMAGLCCGEASILAWPLLRTYARHYIAMDDSYAALGMRLLGRPQGGDCCIIAGESGAAGVGALAGVAAKPELRRQLGLNDGSAVFCVSTEGNTDQLNYQKILAET